VTTNNSGVVAPDYSTSARLAKASERLNILAHELQIAVLDASAAGTDVALLTGVSDRLGAQALDLAELNFAVAEDTVSSSGGTRADRSAAALGRVSRIVEPVFEVASEIAAHLVICAEKAARLQVSLTVDHLSAMDRVLTRLVVEQQQLITGAGVAMAPNTLTDAELWMQWWVHEPSGPVQLRPQLDPGTPGYYNYPSAVWFSQTAQDLAPHLAPPHFDDGGTDAWMVTATVPVIVQGRLLGLACAELTLERMNSLVTPALLAIPAPAALVSPEGLVVASTHPDLLPGATADHLHGLLTKQTAAFTEVAPSLTIARSPALCWRLVADWSQPTHRVSRTVDTRQQPEDHST